MASCLEQLKKFTTVVADTGNFEGTKNCLLLIFEYSHTYNRNFSFDLYYYSIFNTLFP